VQGADAGELSVDGRGYDLRDFTAAQAREAGLHFVHQQSSTFPDLTVAENLAVGRGFATSHGRIRWRAVRGQARDVLERFHIQADPDQPLSELGSATQTMVAIARALQDSDDARDGVLVLDEPTASLPSDEVEELLAALRRYAAAGQTIVYVTHRFEEVFAIADRATLLRDGRLVDTVAPSELTHDGLVELMLGTAVRKHDRDRGGRPDGPVVLEARDLVAPPLRATSIEVRAGEVVGLAGLLGSGRTTLLKALFGAVPVESGEVRVGGEPLVAAGPRDAVAAGIGYVPEDRAGDALFGELTVRENLSLTVVGRYWRRGRIDARAERRDARRLIGEFLISASSEEAPIASLSGGNQQKAVVARWLRREPRVLLLDEPTQGVDVRARTEIYELIARTTAAGGAVLVASSDFEELVTICDRVVVMRNGEPAGEVGGDQLDSDRIHRLAHAEVAA
jgi:ribose transport system ATP-binding protein